jgi:predicted RNase H-like HicB family nuclease
MDIMGAQHPDNPVEGKSYVFAVVVEPDEDRWHSYAPALVKYGAVTWGYTREEALKHIQEVVEMVVEELVEDNIPVPEELGAGDQPDYVRGLISSERA